ncbi:hypothetical protein AHMF7605_12750 [Adhaeribacter arboris]|uniref:SusE outer membrane protein domain-containing protein n=1 Tax=Adhaeribacter arboris TaxID=2072846 RepID=A0A2T2YFQ3_9BACT|nr:SusE domain-containing protein [Adhaeribacter arboris]PSR54322.1 hypothetical protein AHMF7605_12750 [Adhaeribacter arboris]
MKSTFKNILTLLALALFVFACEKDEDKVVISPKANASLAASQTNIVLTEADKGKDAVTFSWKAANFGYDAAVKYSLQFGKKGDNFATAKTEEIGNSFVKTYTVSALNNIATELELPGFSPSDLEVRITARISDQYAPTSSNVLTISVTPFLSEPEYPTVYLVGEAVENGWENTKASAMFRDETDPFVYTYSGNFKAGAFKILGYLGKWAPQWGANSTGGLAFRATEADPDPSSFTIPTNGYYTVKLNLRSNTITIEPYEATGDAYASIGIIGPFTNWENIAPMTKSALNPHIWSTEYTFAEDTEMKFRIAEGWSVNWGADSDATKARTYDKGKRDGPNIAVKAGKYQIYFNDLTGYYLLVKQP